MLTTAKDNQQILVPEFYTGFAIAKTQTEFAITSKNCLLQPRLVKREVLQCHGYQKEEVNSFNLT
jgi:hypothetical protein